MRVHVARVCALRGTLQRVGERKVFCGRCSCTLCGSSGRSSKVLPQLQRDSPGYQGSVICYVQFCFQRSLCVCTIVLQPENLLLGYNKTVKLADFGWSVHAPTPYNLRRTFCGTPDYLSPEMVMGEPYDYRTDFWSLGVLTYELLVGSTPFYCVNQMEMYKRIQLVDYHFPPSPQVSDRAKSFIAGLLKRKPCDRMQLDDASKHLWFQMHHST